MKIHLDLRKDLAKIDPATLGDNTLCAYTAPCAVGAMMSERQRKWLADHDCDHEGIGTLLASDTVTVPAGQEQDLRELQRAFDRNLDRFTERLAELKAKYA